MRRVRTLIAAPLVLATALLAGSAAAAGPAYHLSDNPPTTSPKRGVVITVHGGGWKNYGAESDQLMDL
jgi:Spy/CpxP family protein refolding chaperone